jgi:hypothetical protein
MRTMLHSIEPNNPAEAVNIIDNRSIRSPCCSSLFLKVSPGTMVFFCDMILPIPLIADFELIRQNRQAKVDENARRQNLRHLFHDYNIGEEVLIVSHDHNCPKLAPISKGPYVIQHVHVNGTVTIMRANNIFERFNIRRIRPFHRHGG